MGPDGNLLVVETGAGQLSHIDLTNGAVTALVQGLELGLSGSPAFPPGHICTGIAVGRAGTIYVTSDVNNQLLALPVVDPTLMAHWTLDEVEGGIALDCAGGNDGNVFGDPVWVPDEGQVGGAISLNGIDDYIVASPAVNPADGPFSVFAWVNGGMPGQVVISQFNGDNWLRADSVSGCLTTQLCSSGRGGVPLQSTVNITDGSWHRIGFVWDGVYRVIYVDDIPVAEDSQTGLESCIGGLKIGCGINAATGTFWSGMIDDVRIYSRAVHP